VRDLTKRTVAVMVNSATISFLRCALGRGPGPPEEFVRFGEILRDLVYCDDYRFFIELAKRQDSGTLLRQIFAVVWDPEDRRFIIAKAKLAYSSGTPAVQPRLLAELKQFE